MGYDIDFAKIYTKASIESYKNIIKTVSNICKTFLKIKFILRLHPFESLEPYKILNSNKNFEIH